MGQQGLSLNLHKCELWGPGVSSWDGPPMRLVPWTPDQGLAILGVPINYPGSSVYSTAFWAATMDKLSEAVDRLASQVDPQCAHHLLRKCLDGCKVTHLLPSATLGWIWENAMTSFWEVSRICWVVVWTLGKDVRSPCQ